MNRPQILTIPNVSEGRDESAIQAMADAARAQGVRWHHLSWDPDHHRAVMAFSGSPAQIKRAVLALGEAAVQRIDLRAHQGAHPRIGALDVVPLVPLSGISPEEAIQFSQNVARSFARRLRVPVYLYEHSAQAGKPKDLPTLRKGGFDALQSVDLRKERVPDYGRRLHPTAGATVMGVRDPLIAFNINLDTPDLAIAQALAKQIRHARDHDPSLTGVRALGLWLPSRQIAQVSLNLTRPDCTDLFTVTNYVREAAAALGAGIRETELIGVILNDSAAAALNASLKSTVHPQQIVG